MFADRYFAPRFFPNAYWGTTSTQEPEIPPVWTAVSPVASSWSGVAGAGGTWTPVSPDTGTSWT